MKHTCQFTITFQSMAICRRNSALFQREVVSLTIEKFNSDQSRILTYDVAQSRILKCSTDKFRMVVCVCNSRWRINRIPDVNKDGSVNVTNDDTCTLNECVNNHCILTAVCVRHDSE